MSARTRLIVNADDFGISPSVTDGILEAHAAGTVSSTSMMVGCPGWEDACTKVRGAASLGVGLHVNFLVGTPIVPAVTLMDSRTGTFTTLAGLALRALTSRLDADEVAAECEAQAVAIESLGVMLTHIDSHRHTHALPIVRGAVARVAARRNIPLRRPLESHRRFATDLPSQFHRALIACSWHAASRRAPVSRSPLAPRTAKHFIGVSMQGGVRFERQLLHVLDHLPPGTVELMVHPGRVDAALESVDGYTWQRECELAALISPPVQQRLGDGDIERIHFGQL